MIYTLLLLIAIPLCSFSQVFNGSLIGRAGVHDLSDISTHSIGWNSGSFALARPYSWSLTLPSAAASATNNSFSSSYWNDHIGGDHAYSQIEIQDILSKIPSEGFRAEVGSSAPIVGFVYRKFGFQSMVETAASSTIPKDLIYLEFLGNELNKQYNLANLDGSAQVVLNNSAGLGFKAEQEGIPALFFGATFHYYQGLALAKVARAEGNLMVTDSLIRGSSILQTVESTNGDGIGFDLSVMTETSRRWKLGISARQLGANLTWQVRKNRVESFYTDSTGLIIDSLDQDNYMDRVFHKESETYSGGTIETNLPTILQANAEYLFLPSLKLSGELLYRTKDSAQGAQGVETGAAAEYRIIDWLTGRAGMSFGGLWKSKYGIGLGANTKFYQIDFGLQSMGGVLRNSRGIAVGISHSLKF